MTVSESRFVLADFTYGSSHVSSYLALYATLLRQRRYATTIICHPTTAPKVTELLAEHHCDTKVISIHPSRSKRYISSIFRRTECRINKSCSSIARLLNGSNSHPLTNWLNLYSEATYNRKHQSTSVFFPLGNGMICANTFLWRKLAPPSWSVMLLGTNWMKTVAIQHPGILRNSCLNHPSCKAVFTLSQEDSYYLNQMGVSTNITCLPDITSTVTAPPSARIQQILERTKETRRIVLVGMLDQRKGLIDLLQAAQHLPSNYSVILVGEFPRHAYSQIELEQIDALLTTPSVHFSPGWIENESDINNLIKSSDAVYLAYKNFEGSSNVLTKSAHFSRPVLVTAGTEMGRRVNEFKVGLTTENFAPNLLAEKLETIASLNIPKVNFEQFIAKYGSHDTACNAIEATGQTP